MTLSIISSHNQTMKILMVSSECTPFAKSGGLADVVYSLSKKLGDLGHDVRIIIPGYKFISGNGKKTVGEADVLSGFKKEQVIFSETELPGSSVKIYFAEHPFFSGKEGIYGDRTTGTYRDNHRRFTLLNRSAFALCRLLSWIPDIIHSHDWQASLTAAYVKSGMEGDPFLPVKSVLTIHNIGYQGIFSKHDIHVTGLQWNQTCRTKARYTDHLNFLRTGILNSDRITTVSPRYAEEIQTEKYGEGLENLLVEKKEILSGILNGADYTEWTPEKDPYLPLHYSAETLSPKAALKTMLQSECGLAVQPDKPLFGMVSRLVHQKGFDILCSREGKTLERICHELDVQIVILGNGEEWIERCLEELAEKYSSLKVFITFNNTLAHLIEAGADFFLMPSNYEPCGLNQIYSLKYGTIPVVSNTGGLSDTVTDYRTDPEKGTGFLIKEQTGDAIFKTVKETVELWYSEKASIQKIRIRGMKKDYSWDISAQKYEDLYRELVHS